MEIGYIGGTFDLLHWGHIELFRRVKERSHIVVVSLNTDDFVARYKGAPPVMRLHERQLAVEAVKWVDHVMVNRGGEDSRPAILEARATTVWHDDSWKGESLMEQMGFDQAWLDEHGIKMDYVPRTVGISSTEIKDRLRES